MAIFDVLRKQAVGACGLLGAAKATASCRTPRSGPSFPIGGNRRHVQKLPERGAVERLSLDQFLGHQIQLVASPRENVLGIGVCRVEEPLDLVIDIVRGLWAAIDLRRAVVRG